MSDNIFVDTNVLVYARDASEPEKQPTAIDVMASLWRDRNGRISMQVCSEYFVTVTQKLDPGMDRAKAWDDVVSLFVWSPVPIDEKIMQKARDCQLKYQLSWWDCLIIASALYSGCAVILSEDLSNDQKYFGITVKNPFI